ncbi:hypothetical protein ACIBL6_44855 [Streptomyces sp. NPDC050400]|uniref:hypothetical protein n=1 Tax=Streptomyces sp. NPDC050400 TaxID=3365610 RepID=UPI0037B06A3D
MNRSPDLSPTTRPLARPVLWLISAARSAATALQFWNTGAAEPTAPSRPKDIRQAHGKRSGS